MSQCLYRNQQRSTVVWHTCNHCSKKWEKWPFKRRLNVFYVTPFCFAVTRFLNGLTLNYCLNRCGPFKWPFLKKTVVVFLTVVVCSSLFFSIDPVAKKIWGTTKILDERIYSLHQHLAGNDGITYNLQYFLIAKKRSQQIRQASQLGNSIQSDECHWLFPDPRKPHVSARRLTRRL